MNTVVKTLKESDSDAWNSLHGMSGGFLNGECYAFAIALHRGLGWDIVGLIGRDGSIDHAMVKDPAKGLWDIRGNLDPEEASKPFGTRGFRIVTENDLYETRKIIHERCIEHARKTAETLWPDLPWKSPVIDEFRQFVDELEALCRKHGKWIWGGIPAQQPLISSFPEDAFEGYRLLPTIHGTNFILERQ